MGKDLDIQKLLESMRNQIGSLVQDILVLRITVEELQNANKELEKALIDGNNE